MAQEKSKGASFVTVACKLPNGLILRTFDMVDGVEPVMGGGSRSVKQAREREERFAVFGNSYPQNSAPKCRIVNGYALTPNVPKGIWDNWLEHNKDSLMVKNKIIMAHPERDSIESLAKEHAEIKSGLERIDPKKHPKGIERSDMSAKPQEEPESVG